MKNIICLLLFAVFFANAAIGSVPSDKKAPLTVVETLFAEMAAANPDKIADLFAPDASLLAIIHQPDGGVRRQTFNAQTFSAMFRDKARGIKEVMYDPKVEIHDDWAMVWGRYVFFVEGKISHCGINQLNLVKIDGNWKLANGVTTMEPAGCTDKEKEMK